MSVQYQILYPQRADRKTYINPYGQEQSVSGARDNYRRDPLFKHLPLVHEK